jgi:outer membrane lipoprotein-sorting protein
MRRPVSAFFSLAVVGLICAGVSSAQTAPAPPQTAPAQAVDDIVAKNLKARGGLEKFKSVNSMKISATVTAQGMKLPVTIYSKRPNMMREETDFQGQKMVRAFDGTTAWTINPMMGGGTPQALTGSAANMAMDSADLEGPLVDYRQKGHTIEFVGNEKLDGKEVHHLKITRKTGTVQHLYIDSETGLERKTVITIEQGGRKVDLEIQLTDFKSVDGLMMPSLTRQLMDGNEIAQVSVDKVELNPSIDDSMFKMPK